MCLLEFSIAHFFGWIFTRNLMSLPGFHSMYVQCQWEFCVISVRKKEQKSGMTNPRILYRGSQKFGFTISDTDFQNVAPVKKDIGFSSSPQKKLDFF